VGCAHATPARCPARPGWRGPRPQGASRTSPCAWPPAPPDEGDPDMATIYYDDDADLGLVQSRKVAVLGSASKRRAQPVRRGAAGGGGGVGRAEGSPSRAKAEAAGLTVT